MTTFRRILVNINPSAGAHPALDQAEELARRMHAALAMVDVLPDVPDRARRFVTAEIEQELVDHRWERLRAVAAQRGLAPDDVMLLRGAPGIALISEVNRGGYDLLMRTHGEPGETPKGYGPVDMQLLRKCPCPVWLVGASSSRRPARILAAIDASCNDPGEAELNRSIIAHARAIQSAEEASLTVAYAWEPFGLDVLRHRMNADDFHAFVESARAAAASDVEAFVTSLSDRQNVVLLNGEPHDAIAQYADDAGVDLVVLGTVGRSGFAGAVMGNTAERILSKIRGSVLAIKPEGFVSPIS